MENQRPCLQGADNSGKNQDEHTQDNKRPPEGSRQERPDLAVPAVSATGSLGMERSTGVGEMREDSWKS